MLTVTQLARKFSISRATVLYYEKQGLLKPSARSDNGYRWYGPTETQLLESILAYRSFGLPVAKIADLVHRRQGVEQTCILRDQFYALEKEIETLRQQQKAIVQLLKQPDLLEINMVTKERWVEIMRAAGLREQDMVNWHRKFEAMEPGEHQKFLESLGITDEEIQRIRNL